MITGSSSSNRNNSFENQFGQPLLGRLKNGRNNHTSESEGSCNEVENTEERELYDIDGLYSTKNLDYSQHSFSFPPVRTNGLECEHLANETNQPQRNSGGARKVFLSTDSTNGAHSKILSTGPISPRRLDVQFNHIERNDSNLDAKYGDASTDEWRDDAEVAQTSDPVLESWSKESSKLSTIFPQLFSSPSTITLSEGAKVLMKMSRSAVLYVFLGSLPVFVSSLCLLLSHRPDPVADVAGYALACAINSLVFGWSLGLSGGMDLVSSEAVVEQKWHICWRQLIKCLCVSTWSFFLLLTALMGVHISLGFPQSIFKSIIGDNAADAANVAMFLQSFTYLSDSYLQALHRFLSYQSHITPQVVIICLSSIAQCTLLASIVGRLGKGPAAAAVISSFFAFGRAVALIVYVYVKRYDLGWQSGVRLRLYQRERFSFGPGGRRRIAGPYLSDASMSFGATDGDLEDNVPPKRRARRLPTGRPMQDVPRGLMLARELSVDKSKAVRTDSLHPVTALEYSETLDEERVKQVEKEAATWFDSESKQLDVSEVAMQNAQRRKEVESNAGEKISEGTSSLDSRSIMQVELFAKQSESLSAAKDDNKINAESAEENALCPKVDDECNPVWRQHASSKDSDLLRIQSSFQSLKKAGEPASKRQSRALITATGSLTHFPVPSLFSVRRMSRQVANVPYDQSVSFSAENETPKQLLQKKEEVVTSPTPAHQKRRIRQKTFVSIRSVSVDNQLIFDGWCCPTTCSIVTYLKIQVPRQYLETVAFLKQGIPAAFALTFEFQTLELFLIICTLLGSIEFATVVLVIQICQLFATVPYAVSTSISDQLYFLIRLDHIPISFSLFKLGCQLLSCLSVAISFLIFGIGVLLQYQGSSSLSDSRLHSNVWQRLDQALPNYATGIMIGALIFLADALSAFFNSALRSTGLFMSSFVSTGILLGFILPALTLLSVSYFLLSSIGILFLGKFFALFVCLASLRGLGKVVLMTFH